MVDAQGRLFNGDELLYVMVADRLANRQPVPGVVGTLMTNMAVELALRRLACRWCAPRSATATCWKNSRRAAGSSAVRARATCWRWTATPPATASSARCRSAGRAAQWAAAGGTLLAGVTLFPQTLLNVRLRDGSDWKKNAVPRDEQQIVVKELGDAGRVLIRASGTEPVLRVMVEARDADFGRRCAERLAAAAVSG
jgi:phosphoglucosamine mutase